MKSAQVPKILLAAGLLAAAALLLVRHFTKDSGVSERTFFYDLSERKLFAAPIEALPPIQGLNDAQEDAVRAVVISTGSNPRDASSRKIAYLEKYAPELILHLAEVRAGKAEPLPSKVRNSFRLVKRLEDAEWTTLDSPEGQKILSDWNTPGPDGKMPEVCVP